MKYSEIRRIARTLRNNPTPSEKLLWEFLRKDKLGGRFLRQHPIIHQRDFDELYFYIPDFYCSSAKLVIELDGKIHDYQQERDNHRDEILKYYGLRILRFKNEELQNIPEVLNKIKREIF